uniref:Uncharacterized protein n=1 Tax=Arundo donax TaxID=35708 RepID=A0A0A9DK73_ARUDO
MNNFRTIDAHALELTKILEVLTTKFGWAHLQWVGLKAGAVRRRWSVRCDN